MGYKKRYTMKKILFTLSMIIFGIITFAQNTDTALLSDTKSGSVKSDMDANYLSEINTIFHDNAIEYSSNEFGRIISSTSLRTGISDNSTTLKSIPAGEKVELLKFMPTEKVWAIKFNNNYGFIPISSVMKLKRNKDLEEYPHDVKPILVKKVTPKLPKEAKGLEISNKVLLKVLVNPKGKVIETKFIRGAKELKEEAIYASRKMRFKPAKYKGEDVSAWIKVHMEFTR